MAKGIQLNDGNDLQVLVKRDASGKISGGLVVGDRAIQDAYIVLASNQGDIKEDPLCGANLLRMIRGKAHIEKIRKTVEISLARVKIKLDSIKNQLDVIINKVSV